MATVAVVFAMTGGAIAATGGFTSGGTLKACVNEEGRMKLLKSGERCKRGQKSVSWNQTGPTGGKGATGAAGAQGAQGGQGGQGIQGAQGTALSYGHVTAGGTLDTANSSGVVDAKRDADFGKGYYCIYGSFTPHVATASIDYNESMGREIAQNLGFSGDAVSGCPASATGAPVRAAVLVRDYTSETAALTDAGFYIIFN